MLGPQQPARDRKSRFSQPKMRFRNRVRNLQPPNSRRHNKRAVLPPSLRKPLRRPVRERLLLALQNFALKRISHCKRRVPRIQRPMAARNPIHRNPPGFPFLPSNRMRGNRLHFDRLYSNRPISLPRCRVLLRRQPHEPRPSADHCTACRIIFRHIRQVRRSPCPAQRRRPNQR